MRGCSDPAARFTDGQGCTRPYVALHDADDAYTAVLSRPGLLNDVDPSARCLSRLYASELIPMLLVGHMDRTRMLTPVFAAVGVE